MHAQRFPHGTRYLGLALVALPLLLVLVACSVKQADPTPDAGGANNEADAGGANNDAVAYGGKCRTGTECAPSESCFLPGHANCGVRPLEECVLGASCIVRGLGPDAGDEPGVCVVAGACGGSRCIPPCQDDGDCGGSAVGHCTMSTGLCGPPTCTADADCNDPNLACSSDAVRVCAPKKCSADTDCGGFCSSGTCSGLGTCGVPAP